jgi:hypothetical protein
VSCNTVSTGGYYIAQCEYECYPGTRGNCRDWIRLTTFRDYEERCDDGTVRRSWSEWTGSRTGNKRNCDIEKEGPWGCCDGWERE